MTTVALTASPATIDPGTAYELTVLNSGSSVVHVQIGGGAVYDQRLNPGQSVVVHPNGQAVTGFARSGTGQVDTTLATNPEPTVGSGTSLPRLSGPLGGWKAKIATYPATAKVVFLGDSTSDPTLNAAYIYRRILGLHTQQGEALYGLASTDYFTDGVGNATTTFTSATANFTAADVGRLVHGKGFPIGTVITARASATSVTLSAAIPTGTALPFWIGRHVIGGGNNGMPLSFWMANPAFTSGSGRYNQGALLADAPDLTVASWLINDVRQGALGLTVDAIVAAGIVLLQSFIDWHRTNLPTTDLLLRMPNSLLTADVGGSHYVTDGTTTNPAGQAQIYSTALRRIYLSFVGKYQNVDVLDAQAEVFGTRSATSSVLMTDQLHPSGALAGDVSLLTPTGGGYCNLGDAVAKRIGFARNAFAPDGLARVRQEYVVYDAPAAGQVRLMSRDYNHPAAQGGTMRSDSLYVNGVDGPIALTAATLDKNTSNNWLVITGLGATDFSPFIGQTATIVGSHAPSTGDATVVNFDLPSIAAGGTLIQTFALTGVATGNQGHRTRLSASPPAGFMASGLMYTIAPAGTDSAQITFYNPTAGAIDRPSENWTVWIDR